MARYERVAEIFDLLSATSEPLSLESLCTSLDASTATVKRLVRFLREELLVPVEFDREQRGYRIRRGAGPVRPIPGTGYDTGELATLLTAVEVLEQIPPGAFAAQTRALRARLGPLAQQRSRSAAGERVRVALPQRRAVDAARFQTVVEALSKQQRLRIDYRSRSRSRDGGAERIVSPQRLTFYRSNWYLAAYCHDGGDLRVFALDRVQRADLLPLPAHVVPARTLDARLSSGYGIFDGAANAVAVLRFSADAARWVADEEWHPAQTVDRLPDGGLLLHVPFRHTTELRMDVLRYGAEVEVLAPPELRAEVAATLSTAAGRYH